MSKEFDDLCEEIEGRSGAAERIEAEVNRMIGVLELEKLRARTFRATSSEQRSGRSGDIRHR